MSTGHDPIPRYALFVRLRSRLAALSLCLVSAASRADEAPPPASPKPHWTLPPPDVVEFLDPDRLRAHFDVGPLLALGVAFPEGRVPLGTGAGLRFGLVRRYLGASLGIAVRL